MTARKRLHIIDDGDLVRIAYGLEMPIVGAVREGREAREMREMALICGFSFNLGAAPGAATARAEAPEMSTKNADGRPAPGSARPSRKGSTPGHAEAA